MGKSYPIYLETGKRRTFAVSIDWPGWCAHGRDEERAIQSLLDAGPRYASIVGAAGLDFIHPRDADQMEIVERVEGNSVTDFGAPDIVLPCDDSPIDEGEAQHFQAVLLACWRAFDRAVEGAQGVELRKGPRGGGRDLDKIVEHVVGAERGYLSALGWKVKLTDDEDLSVQVSKIQQGMREGLAESAAGNLPKQGPRGGKRWPARYYVRRSGYHITDHIWEIEDRTIE